MTSMSSITTILKFGHNKNCFLNLVDSYQRQHNVRPSKTGTDDGVVVYETELSRGRKAYFSLQGKVVELMSGDTVQLNGLYGNKLGLKDGEPLPLKQIKAAVPTARRVQVELLSSDDWEIMEQNAGRVEAVLLDQVRVVWPGQVLPVWIQRSICVFMKIMSVEPVSSTCVILESNSEISVAPKVRASHPPTSLSLPSQHSIPQPVQQQPQQPQTKQQQQLPPPTSKAPLQKQQHTLGSPCKIRARDAMSTSDYDNADTLEPKPLNRSSPGRSPRLSRKKIQAPKSKNFLSSSDSFSERGDTVRPMVRRQSSLMESVMKYIFPFMSERREDFDNRSDSDAGSAIDYSMKNLPSRNGVLRVQPMKLSCTLEECLSHDEINKPKSLWGSFMSNSRRPSFESHLEDAKKCNVPSEVFHPSTIYVDAECTKTERHLHPYLPILPNNFIAKLKKIPSPQEKAEASQKVSKKSKGDGKDTGGPGPTTQTTEIESPTVQDPPTDNGWSGESSSFSSSCYVRVVAIDRKAGLTDDAWQEAADKILSEQPLLHGHVVIPDLLRRQLKLDATCSVWLQTGPVDLVIPRKVCIYPLSSVPKKVTNDMLVTAFRNYIRKCADREHPIVVFQGIFLKYMLFPESYVEVQLTFFGENDLSNVKAVTMLSEMNIDLVLVIVERNLKEDKMGVVNSMLSYCQTADFDPLPLSVKLKHLGGMDEIAQQALRHLMASLGARPLSRNTFQARCGLSHGILLITGPKGCGKTSLVKGLCRRMSHLPVLAYTSVIDCKTLRGKTVSHIQRILEAVFDEAAWREPSVIVLDNLDVIVPAPSGPETEMNGEALYAAKNSQVLQGLLNYEVENNSRVMVIATSTSRSSLHPSLVSSRGKHFIQQTLNIGSPDKEAREKILDNLLQNHASVTTETVKTLDLSPVAVKTEGFVARDLECLVNRAIHNKLICDRDAFKNKVTLTFEDFEMALCDYKPASIRNVPLHKAGDLGWDDVGGLNSVKTALTETLRWPTKYPQLFSACPLRLRSGILLYGAPGTGKTLLAGVVAKECGLNFISIKGPELLSKYIGASEQAVRDLFIRAQRAKPCILFFDEFDSIAPKRGHDSTGVTDRVVNQLLTQLDGVEGLQGVYVLGATSRPDLIDPALLRPGRLDKCLNCAIPDSDERCAILKALTRKMSLACDVDLEEIAVMCEYFTGADLKALLYNGQLKAIHEQASLDRSFTDSVVRIKGDDAQCSILSHTNLPSSEPVSPGNMGDNSPRSTDLNDSVRSCESSLSSREHGGLDSSRGDEKSQSHDGFHSPRRTVDFTSNSPRGKKNASQNKTQKEAHKKYEVEEAEEVENPEDYEDQFVSPVSLFRGTGPNDEMTTTHQPFLQAKKHTSNSNFEDQVEKLDLEKLDLRFIDDGNGSPSPTSGRSENSEQQGDEKKTHSLSKDSEYKELEKTIADSLIAVSDRFGNDFVSTLIEKPIENHMYKTKDDPLMTIQNMVTEDSYEMDVKSKEQHENEQVAIRVQKSSTSDAEGSPVYPDPAHTYPPTNTKRKRAYQRTQSENADGKKNLSITKPDPEAKSPSVEKPVTVFTSLERGLATLSAEDEARYLAMVKEIQRRDENLFEAANARRRTSLQLASRSSALLQVCQRHLVEAAQTMRPSVSSVERQKYLRIYENFMSTRTGDFDKGENTQVGKRATLA